MNERSELMASVLMLEFNELSPTLMHRFIAEGHLPAFARLRSESATFITEAGETGDALNPWVQWVTVHTGVTANEHGVARLGEAQRLKVPALADVVSEAGGSVWQCGTMNVAPTGPINGCLLPDPWSVDALPQPAELTPFFRFVSANVQEHTRAASPLSRRETLAFVRFLATHGLTPATALAAARQLAGERAARTGRWRRAELLDRFQWDVFRWYHQRLHPRLASFFSNSTAHFQHLYWDEMERAPDDSAVLHGYQQMDRLVQRALALADADTTIVLCTALSQAANTEADRDREGFYRAHDLDRLVYALGVAGVEHTSPVMAEQSHIFFADEDRAKAGAMRLEGIRSRGDTVFAVDRKGNDVFVGCRFFTRRPLDAPLDELLYWTDAPREGSHHPDGILWIGTGGSDRHDVRVPLTAVAPTILSLLDIPPPSSMHEPPLLAGSNR